MMRRADLVLAVVAALVVALAVAAWVVSSNRQPTPLPSGSPEATVQAYLRAVADGDDKAVVELLDPALGCSAPMPQSYVQDAFSSVLVSSTTTGDRAVVVFELTHYGDAPFDSWSQRESFDLVRAAPGWLIGGSPWPVFGCK